ncbi:hypothetical protein L873DRAFT_1820272 [Choiromyces venosus 120613-1]|uniref:Uncharacterized protein n=1 Tax=Choiromyces venosus 120613-1 TaxID=1336337 RepID=A0A3N4J171_9PEZI|nr:hypothetical protein L873DRAFT_1820272 [Choiromyces venosus 120613-1]
MSVPGGKSCSKVPGTSHVAKHRLVEMPCQKFVRYTMWIRRIATHRIKTSAIYAGVIKPKYDDLVVILLQISENGGLKDSRDTHVRVNRNEVAIKISVDAPTKQKAILTRVYFCHPKSDVPDPSPIILLHPVAFALKRKHMSCFKPAPYVGWCPKIHHALDDTSRHELGFPHERHLPAQKCCV